MYYLGEMSLDCGEILKAVGLFEQALEKDPRISGGHYRLAQCAMSAGENELAAAHLQQELALETEDTEVLISIGSMFSKLGKYDAALHCFLRCLDEDDKNAHAYHFLGRISAMQGEYRNAKSFFETAIEINPRSPEILKDLAKLYLLLKDYPIAAKYAEAAKNINPAEPEITILLRQIRLRNIVSKLAGGLKVFRPARQDF